ncbi:TonB-dependent receptor [Gammaproteobacteria bacterium AB-CW1]|uniref:TonB-dependent receptor n=2 Tax=Natronospira TaxID=2024969 RepID=A0AAP6JDZ5_9GAMM|nr:TonB-dependent receptor [Gammaproteobacteria bacterium AB-CW1]
MPIQAVSRPLALAVSLALVPLAAQAGSDDFTEALEMDFDLRELAPVSITGTRNDIREIPGSAHLVSRDEIEAAGYGDPHRMLRSIPGVYIQEEEGFGLFPNISIRGSRSERARRITMMEDGVLIAPAPYAAPAAYHVPTAMRMERIEVLKGAGGIQHGPYTTGGSLNMVSTPVPESRTARAQFMLGSDGGRRHQAMIGDSGDNLGFMLEAVDAGSDGFRRLDRAQRRGPNMAESDTGFDLRDVVGKLRWEPRNGDRHHSLELKFARSTREANETYLGLTQDDFGRHPFRRYAGSQLDQINTEHEQLSLRHHIELGDANLTTTVYNNDFSRNWYKLHDVWDGQGNPDFVGISAVLANPTEHSAELAWIRGEGGDARGKVRANNREYYSRGVQTVYQTWFDAAGWSHQLEAGLRYHQDEEDRLQWEDVYRMENFAMTRVLPGSEPGAVHGVPGSTTNRVTQADALAVHVQNRLRRGNWTLIPGLRYEDITIERTDFQAGEDPDRGVITGEREGEFSVFIPGFGAIYQLNPELNAFFGIHRGFAPTGASPDVDEEKSTNYEAGIRFVRNGVQLELIGFLTAFDNLVGTCTAASGGGCEVGDVFQAGEVDVFGLEAMLRYDLADVMDLGISLPLEVAYTYTNTELKSSFESDFSEWGDVSRGDELPHIPAHQLNLALRAVANDWQFRFAANYVDETRSVAGSGSIPANQTVDARWLFDVSGEYALNSSVRAFASVENLFDETYVSARSPAGARVGLPRTAWAGMRLEF